jgi:hypothetical protein
MDLGLRFLTSVMHLSVGAASAYGGEERHRRKTVKKRIWVPALALVAVSTFGQEASQKMTGRSQEQVRETAALVTVSISEQAACAFSGTITAGQTIDGQFTYSDCSSYLSGYGTLYADFYTLHAQAGHTYQLEAESMVSYLATFQDHQTGAVLTSTDTCGFLHVSCAVTYTTPYTADYSVGLGGLGTGSYTLRLYDVTVNATPTPYPTRGPLPTPTRPPLSGCYTSYEQVCLNQRFTVTVHWDTTDGRSGAGVPVPISSDTAYFYFFNPSNAELCVKVLDGRAINNHTWVFYGALSNVHYTIRVVDTVTGATRLYDNPQGLMASVGDTTAF